MNSSQALIGQSAAFLDVMEQASAAAALNRPVLVIGERGTGKELVAERLHRLSPRWARPFIELNCAALPETLIDAELFGAEAGAFTGATRARAGRFEEADGGTLFLDEIGTLSAQAQEKLLRAIEYGAFQRIGSSRTLSVDVRVVGATNIDLPARAAAGSFRADLLDRLSFDVITLPPLRARQEDIALLADHFGRRMASEIGWPGFPGFSAKILRDFADHRWPGNVRELKNVVERAVYRWPHPDEAINAVQFDPFSSPWRPHEIIAPAAAPVSEPPAPAAAMDYKAQVTALEHRLLTRALEEARYNQRAAAALLHLSYDQFRHAARKHKLLIQSSPGDVE